MNSDKNFYEILGLTENASKEEVKKQYHKLVRIYHPDIAKNKAEANEKFILINEAYKALKDNDLRQAYDFGLKESRDIANKPVQKEEPQQEEEIIIETPEMRRKKEMTVSSILDNVRSLIAVSKSNEALQLLDKAINLKSNSWEAWELKGDILREQRSYDTAMAAYSKASQLSGSNPSIRQKLMDTVAERSGKPRKAPSASTSKGSGFFGKLFKK